MKHIDDFPPFPAGRFVAERVNVTGLNIEAKSREQTAQDGKFRQIIESNDDNLVFRDVDLNRLARSELRGHPNVTTDLRGRETGEVIIVHPAEKLIDNRFFDAGASGLNSFFPLFADHTLSYQEAWDR